MKHLNFIFLLFILISCNEIKKEDLLVNKKWVLHKLFVDNKDVSGKLNECNRFSVVFYSNKRTRIIRKECLHKIESDLVILPFWNLENNQLTSSSIGEAEVLLLDEKNLVYRIERDDLIQSDRVYWFKFNSTISH